MLFSTPTRWASPEPSVLPAPARRWIGPAAAVALMLPPLWIGEFGTLVLSIGGLYIMSALGLHILTHWAGQISLGHVAFVALGAFLTAKAAAEWNLPFYLALLTAVVACLGASVLVGLPALRIRGFNIAITTLAFGLAADRWLFRLEWLSGGSSGIAVPKPRLPGMTFEGSRSTYYLVAIATVGLIALAGRVHRSKAGRAFLAIRADEEVASARGIDVATYKLLAFMVAGGFAGLAGGLWALTLGLVGSLTFPVSLSIQFVAIVVIAGSGRIWGSVAAAALFGMLPSLQTGFGRFSTLTGALGILAVIVRYPGGMNEIGARIGKVLRTRIGTHRR